MTLLISDTGGRFDRVPELMRTFSEHRVEGMIYVADHHRKVSLPPVIGGGQLVLANCFDDRGTPCILPHDRQGQKMLTAELIRHGHRRIAYLTLSNSLAATPLRIQGYREALDEAGLPFDPALVIPADLDGPNPDAEAQLLWDAIDRILALDVPPSVICCGNDRMAMRAYGILRSRGVALPEQMSVAGYDNYRLITDTLYPTLTSAELSYAAIGARAAHLLLGLIRGEPAPEAPHLVSGPVVWRDSVTTLNQTVTQFSSLGRKTT